MSTDAPSTNGDSRAALREARARRRLAETELEVGRLKLLQDAQRRQQRFLESCVGDGWGSLIDPRDSFDGSEYDYRAGYYTPYSQPGDRKHGQNWPLVQNLQELSRLRQQSRILCATNAYARGALKHLVNYVNGPGCKYDVVSKEKTPDADPAKAGGQSAGDVQRVVAQVQDFVDEWCRLNRWNAGADYHRTSTVTGTRERELVARVFRDGEAFVRLFPLDDGASVVRFVEPEQVEDPPGVTVEDGWSFGIQHQMTPFEDVETKERIHVRYQDLLTEEDGDTPLGDLVPAGEIVHVLMPDTDSTIKRGVPAFSYDTFDAFRRAAKLQRNISIGAGIRAALALIRKHAAASAAQVESFVTGGAYAQRVNPVTRKTENLTKYDAGTVLDIPEGLDVVQPPANTGTPEHLQAVQGDMRQAASAFATSESMISADASNTNFASALVASAPFVRNTETDQAHFRAAFLCVVWRAVRHAVSKGRLPRQALTLVEIQCEAPTVVHVDKTANAQANQIAIMTGWKSRQTAALEDNLDPEVELKNNEEYQQRFGDQGAELPMPDDGFGPPDQGDLAPRPPGGLGEAIQEAVARAVRTVLLEAGTCKPGERSDLTGCAPASKDGGGGKEKGGDTKKDKGDSSPTHDAAATMQAAQAKKQQQAQQAADAAKAGDGGSSGDKPAADTPATAERRQKALERAKEKVKALVAKGKEKAVAAVASHQHVAPVIEAYKNAEAGQAGKAVGKAVAAEAAKKLGKSVTERITGFSKELWDEVSTKHGKTAAVIASGAYMALNRASLVAETATGIRLIPGAGGAVATARNYACYYGVRAAADGIMAGVNLLRGKRAAESVEAVEAAEPELTPEAILAALREYDQRLSEFAGVEPGAWDDAEVLEAIADLLEEQAGEETPRPFEEADDAPSPEEAQETAELMADVLYGLFGADALAALTEEEVREAWAELDHPRGKNGRFIPKGSAEALGAAKDYIKEVKGKPATPETAEKLSSHLANLNVKQLRDLHKEHGEKAPGKLRQQLVDNLKERLPGAAKAAGGEAKGGTTGFQAEITRNDDQRFEKRFGASAGDYTVSAQRKSPYDDDKWLVRFTLKQPDGTETEKLTGGAGAEAVPILRTVAASVDDFVARRRPAAFEFTADSREPGRVRLYDKAAGLIARRHGYDLRRTGGHFVGYEFQRQKAATEATRKLAPFEAEFDAIPECDGTPCAEPGCKPKGAALLEDAPLLDVPDERQTTSYSCGAACVASVCRHFGTDPDTESDAVRALGSSPADGTDPEHIIQVLQAAGLETTALSGMDLDALGYYLGKGRPVIVCLQAWGTPDERAALEAGHYVVACGLDEEAVTVMDPARFAPGEGEQEYQEAEQGQKVRVPRDVFLERWRDTDSEQTVYNRYGIAVTKR